MSIGPCLFDFVRFCNDFDLIPVDLTSLHKNKTTGIVQFGPDIAGDLFLIDYLVISNQCYQPYKYLLVCLSVCVSSSLNDFIKKVT